MESSTMPHDPIPDAVRKRAKAAMQRARVFTNYNGTGFGMTADPEVWAELSAGWEVGVDDEQRPIVLRCGGGSIFKMSRDFDAPQWWEFWLPPALVPVAREIHAERRAA